MIKRRVISIGCMHAQKYGEKGGGGGGGGRRVRREREKEGKGGGGREFM